MFWRKILYSRIQRLEKELSDSYFYEFYRKKRIKQELKELIVEYKDYCKLHGYISYNYL